MFARCSVRGLLLLCLGSSLVGCSNPSGLDSIQVTPTSQSLTVGQTAQLTAVGKYGNASHPSTQNINGGVTWSSSTPTVATVSTTGLVTAVAAGTTTITAGATAFNGDVNASTLVTVTGAGGGGGSTGGVLVSLTIIPSTISVGNLQDTGQFLAVGTFSTAPFVRDLTNSPTVTWISSFPSVFPVDTNTAGNLGATAGVVTAYGNGSANITVEAKNPSDGTLQTATATFNCPLVLPNPPNTPGSCFEGSQANALLNTLTVYNEGLNTTDWRVTAPSATGTAAVLHCGPGSRSDGSGGPAGSVCTTTYPINFQSPSPGLRANTVILEATGGDFGGWSWSCTPSNADGKTSPVPKITQQGPNYCTVNFGTSTDSYGNTIYNTNVTVGAIFN